ncbi:MAG TPA: hypothetical protein VJ875_17625 [Pyrinomonadaceae bacterium]|nr:hypothetical protein [Pyrinomonadaceae bacterium]
MRRESGRPWPPIISTTYWLTMSKNNAGVFVGRIQGMLKAAPRKKPDLATWLRPTLKGSPNVGV